MTEAMMTPRERQALNIPIIGKLHDAHSGHGRTERRRIMRNVRHWPVGAGPKYGSMRRGVH